MLDSSKLEENAGDYFKVDENGGQHPEGVENAVGKGEIAPYEQFLLFPKFSIDLYCRHVKTMTYLGKG